jgi:uncharacterized delta-60 repeat protein
MRWLRAGISAALVWGSATGWSQVPEDGFNPGGGLPLAVQPDGKVLVGGNGGYTPGISRVNADGSTDTNFNAIVPNTVSGAILQSDGKIVIGGQFQTVSGQGRQYLARLNSDGSLDTSYVPNWNNLSDGVSAMARQNDGKILLGDSFFGSGYLARFSPDGIFDTNFIVSVLGGVTAFAIDTNTGAIFVGGNFSQVQGQARLRLAKIGPDGSLDGSFNPGAYSPGNGAGVNAIALQDDGKILIGGYFTVVAGQSISNFTRLNSNGTIDGTFNPNANKGVNSILLQPGGKMLVGGSFTMIGGQSRFSFALLNPDGSADPWTPAAVENNGYVSKVMLQPDGRIVIGGSCSVLGGRLRHNIARLNTDGSIDAPGYPDMRAIVVDVAAMQPDGKIVVAGGTSNGSSPITRLNPDCSAPDPTFTAPDIDAYVNRIAIQFDGKIVIAGGFSYVSSESHYRLARLNSDGSLDTGFNLDLSADGHVVALAVEPDGKVLVAGLFSSLGGQPITNLARFNVNGTLDPSFNPNPDGSPASLTIQADGRILVTGGFYHIGGHSFSSGQGIVRLNSNGSFDSSFASSASPSLAALQADGQIVVVDRTQYLRRISATGTVDSSFNPSEFGIDWVAVQADGKILYGNINSFKRINANGSADKTFAVGSNFGSIHSLLLQVDGKMLVGGIGVGWSGSSPGFMDSKFRRWLNTVPGSQTLSISPDGTSASWVLTNTAPVPSYVEFQYSTNGTDWTELGLGAFSAGSWRLAGLAIPGPARFLRALGVGNYQSQYSSCSSFIQAVIPLMGSPPALAISPLAGNLKQVIISGDVGLNYDLLSSSNLLNWELLLNFNLTNSPKVYVDPGSATVPRRFYRLRPAP